MRHPRRSTVTCHASSHRIAAEKHVVNARNLIRDTVLLRAILLDLLSPHLAVCDHTKKHRATTQMHLGRDTMDSFLRPLAAASMIIAGALASTAPASAQQAPIKIGIPTSVQLQVGRDTQNAAKLAIE